MSVGEAWGLKVGEDVEFALRTRGKPLTWRLGKVLRFDLDKSIWIKDKATGRQHRVGNPRMVRLWKPPSSLDDIEKFLED